MSILPSHVLAMLGGYVEWYQLVMVVLLIVVLLGYKAYKNKQQ